VAVAVRMQLVPVEAFKAITVDSTVMEKAIAHPTDSRLLEVARSRVIQVAKAAGLPLLHIADATAAAFLALLTRLRQSRAATPARGWRR
jgi:hypothetical protein